jgi:hypothetical protein
LQDAIFIWNPNKIARQKTSFLPGSAACGGKPGLPAGKIKPRSKEE